MNCKKKIFSLILSTMLVLNGISGIFATNSVYADGENQDKGGVATVSIEDSLSIPSESEYPAPKGLIVDHYKVAFNENETMMDCVRRACNENGVPIKISHDGTYISSIDGLSEFDKGTQSGWMGTLNGWFTDVGFASIYPNAKEPMHRLKNGDDIHLFYTLNLGKDIGDTTGEKFIKSLKVSSGTLSPEFNQDKYEYTLDLGEETDAEISLNPVALHQKNHVKIIKDDKIYEPTSKIEVKNGDKLYIRCGAYEDVTNLKVDKSKVKEYLVSIKANEIKNETPQKVTLDFFANTQPEESYSFKIFDSNGKEKNFTELSSLSEITLTNDNIVPEPEYTYSEPAKRWNLDLDPGKYIIKGYLKNVNNELFESNFTVKSNKENHEIFNCYKLNIVDKENYELKVENSIKVIDFNGELAKVFNYNVDDFYYSTFMLKYCEGGKASVLVNTIDDTYTFSKDDCKIASDDLEFLNLEPKYLYAEVKGNIFSLKMYDTGFFMVTYSLIELECSKEKVKYIFRYPKDLENFQVCEMNSHAYQKFKPIEELKDKYNISDWNIDKSNTEYNELSFTAIKTRMPFLITGGGKYIENGKEKESKYMKALFYESSVGEFKDNERIFYPKFIKQGEKPEYLPTQKEDNWHGNNAENTVLTILKDEGQYQPLQRGKIIDFFTFRINQGTSSSMGNTIMEPDKNFKIFGDSISISPNKGSQGREWNEVKGEKNGASIVAIGYNDGMFCYDELPDENINNITELKERQYFPTIDPDRIGIAIFDVDGTGEKIKPNINRMTKYGEKPLRKYDRVHFVKSIEYPNGTKKELKTSMPYTFKPTCEDGSDVKVYYHKPIKSMNDFNNPNFFSVPNNGKVPGGDWIPAKISEKGSTVELEHGNNVILMKSGNHTRYFVIAATGLNIKTKNLSRNGKMFAKGDKVQIRLRGLTLPVPKLSAIYNPGFPDTTYLSANVNGKEMTGPHIQYNIKDFDWIIDSMPKRPMMPDETKKLSYTIDGKADFKMKNIYIHSGRFGDGLDGHCNIGPEEGRPPNLSADEYKDEYFGAFEDITIPVLHLEYPKESNNTLNSLAGDDSATFIKKQSKGLVVTFKNAEAKDFVGVKLNGKQLEKENYKVDSDTFDITIEKAFLKTLKDGSHKIEVMTKEGSAEGTIIISDKKINKNDLVSTIVKAKKATEGIKTSTDGSELFEESKWSTKADKDTLATAIKKAETVIKNGDATQEEVDAAKAELENAIKTYNNAVKPGLKKHILVTTEDKVNDGNKVVASANSVIFTKGESSAATFKIPDLHITDFISVAVDGKTLDKVDYDANEGSIIVTIKKNYIEKLSLGKHSVTIETTKGTAEGILDVKEKTAESNTTKVTNSIKKSINTGDLTNIYWFIGLLLLSTAVYVVILKRKSRTK